MTSSRWLASAVLAAMIAFAAVVPAQAQFGFESRPRFQRSPGFFDRLFGPGPGGGYYEPQQQYQGGGGETSKAPAPKKSDTTPTVSIMVMGDSTADWLAYGLEEALADSPEIGVVRKSKLGSGLLRYEQRSDLDWWRVARDTLGKEKADIVVMMLGINDRQPFRETQADKKPDKGAPKKGDAADKPAEAKPAEAKPADAPEVAGEPKPDEDELAILAPEPRSAGGARGVVDFRTERWEEIYTKRIDETIAALKSKNVPVIWVGLPPLRGTRSTADVQYLNNLYRARAEKAGIVFVDVWDGFVDEAGKFTTRGPDFEGQVRNLRSGDGVHFTKFGARKIAHYVERELRRFISNRSIPMALPSPDAAPAPLSPDGRPGAAVRPVAGPVVPLTATPGAEGEQLLGGSATRPTHVDPTATRVLVRGEPVAPPPGRADDFTWPRGGDASAAVEPISPTAAAAQGAPDAPKGARKGKPEPKADAKADTKKQDQQRRAPPAAAPRPPQQVQQQQPRAGGPFGWLR